MLLLTSYSIYSVGEWNTYSNKVFRTQARHGGQPAPEDHWGRPQLNWKDFLLLLSACHNMTYGRKKTGLRKSRTQDNRQLHVAHAPRWQDSMMKQAAKPALSEDSYNLINGTGCKKTACSACHRSTSGCKQRSDHFPALIHSIHFAPPLFPSFIQDWEPIFTVVLSLIRARIVQAHAVVKSTRIWKQMFIPSPQSLYISFQLPKNVEWVSGDNRIETSERKQTEREICCQAPKMRL